MSGVESCLAAGTPSPLPNSLTPGRLLQRSLRSTSSRSLFTFRYTSHTSTLLSLFLHILSLFPQLPHGTPHGLARPAPPPQSLSCSPRSCPRSNSSLAFVPSSQVCTSMYVDSMFRNVDILIYQYTDILKRF